MSAPAPDYLAPVSGWRSWRVDRAGTTTRLRSVVSATPWPVGKPLVAECRRLPFAHAPPGRGCRCGIHAARKVAEAAFHAELPSRGTEPLAVGLVALWGRVVEGEDGWRASTAYPEALYLPLRRPEDHELSTLIAWDLSAYGVPIELLDCRRAGVAQALLQATPRAAGPLPAPIPA